MNEILLLISQTVSLDEYGDPVAQEVNREVFGSLRSVGQAEFYQAQAAGLKPELKFRLADYLDYEGEMWAEYDGQRFRVLRTYRTGQELELTLYREVNPA